MTVELTSSCLLLLAHELLCIVLFWSVFCRSALTCGQRTKLSVRISLLILGAAALAAMAAPLYGWHPDMVSLFLLIAYDIMQVTAAELWRAGVPQPFLKTQAR